MAQFNLRFFLVTVLCLFLVCIAPLLFGQDKKITATGDAAYPPFSFINDKGEPDGFDVELVKALAELLGFDIEIVLYPWPEARRRIETGEVDMIINMFYSESRDRIIDFSIPHSILYYSLFVREDSNIKRIEDISGLEIMLPESNLIHDYMVENDIGITIITVNNNHEAMTLLTEGEHDAAILERMQGLYEIETYNLSTLRLVDEGFLPQKACFGVQEGNIKLLSKLNEGLKQLEQNGTFAEIYNHWFGILERKSVVALYGRIILPLVIVVALILILQLFWNRSLNKQVKIRTHDLNFEILQRTQVEQRLENSLREKEILLAEIHHRVKNNLQILLGLMEMQKNQEGSESSELFILNTQNRIHTISLIHDHLYNSQEFSQINISAYVSDLVEYIMGIYNPTGSRIMIDMNIPQMKIIYEKVLPIGLLISEIITNSIKYAFPNQQKGIIRLSAYTENKLFQIKIEDNGIGFSIDISKTDTLGLKLINVLVLQLGGKLTISKSPGTCYEISIPTEYLTGEILKPM